MTQNPARIYASPQQQCLRCGRVQTVVPDGRGFPPDIAKRRLVKACKGAGCPCEPKYTAGHSFALQLIEEATPCNP